jgi:hypothetical protein
MKKEIINELQDVWTKEAKRVLLGRKITSVRYMTDDEAEVLGWSKRSIVLTLDNKILCYMSMDDEGNDGGSMFYDWEDGTQGVLPTL